ncbi:UNVERIFIED_CONTAM: movement protein [Sesamum radiatum]|uniref:Movement protein n=1 Tax=Sesamum radiatum TaxID=300843 RepID=A0AAW2VNE7_SESRA
MELTGNVMEMQLIPKEEILEELSKLREEVATTMKWIHIGTIEVVIKATFKEGIDSEIHLSIMDRRINNLRDGCLGTMIGNLYAGKLMFDIHPRIAYNLADQDFSRVLTLHQDFKRKDLMKEGNRPYSITYRIAYTLSNTHHSDLFLRKEYIEIPRIFKEFAKQPVIGKYEGMLEIADHETLVAEYFAAYIDSGSGICIAKSGVFPKEAMETLLVIAGTNFSQKILILNKGIREAKIMIGGAFGTPWFRRLIQRNFNENPLAWWNRNKIEATQKVKEECKYEHVRYRPIQMNMKDKKDMRMIIKEHINLGLIEPGVSTYSSPDFLGQYIWNVLPMGLANAPQIILRKMDNLFKDYFEFMNLYLSLAKYRKDFRPFLKETESSKWKCGEIHTQRVRELKQVCSNLPKLAIPQDEDELVVYTDANDYQ